MLKISRKISWYYHLFQHVQTNVHLQTPGEQSWPSVSCPSKADSAAEGKLFCSTCNIGADAPSCTEFCKRFVFYTILTWLHETKQWSAQFKWWTFWEIILVLASLESICWLCFSWKRCRHRKARALRRCTHAGASSGGAVGIPLAERKKKLAGQQGLCTQKQKWYQHPPQTGRRETKQRNLGFCNCRRNCATCHTPMPRQMHTGLCEDLLFLKRKPHKETCLGSNWYSFLFHACETLPPPCWKNMPSLPLCRLIRIRLSDFKSYVTHCLPCTVACTVSAKKHGNFNWGWRANWDAPLNLEMPTRCEGLHHYSLNAIACSKEIRHNKSHWSAF